eukprot:scaffold7644_cov325-Pinguiococcus_pyrenoidosus.AAC.2
MLKSVLLHPMTNVGSLRLPEAPRCACCVLALLSWQLHSSVESHENAGQRPGHNALINEAERTAVSRSTSAFARQRTRLRALAFPRDRRNRDHGVSGLQGAEAQAGHHEIDHGESE